MIYYTIQNDFGDRGFIQIVDLENLREIDQVTGYTAKFDPQYKHCYLIISEAEYESVRDMHKKIDAHSFEEDVAELHALTDKIIENNKTNSLLKGDVH